MFKTVLLPVNTSRETVLLLLQKYFSGENMLGLTHVHSVVWTYEYTAIHMNTLQYT